MIVAMDAGVVRETGSHAELMERRGLYYSLVNRQLAGKDEDFENKTSADESHEDNRAESVVKSRRQLTKQVSIKVKAKKDEYVEKQSRWTMISRLMHMNRPEWPWILVGTIFAVFFGSLTPLFGTLFGDVMEVFYPCDPRVPDCDPRRKMQTYALYFGGIGAGFLIAQAGMNILQQGGQSKPGFKIRSAYFPHEFCIFFAQFDQNIETCWSGGSGLHLLAVRGAAGGAG